MCLPSGDADLGETYAIAELPCAFNSESVLPPALGALMPPSSELISWPSSCSDDSSSETAGDTESADDDAEAPLADPPEVDDVMAISEYSGLPGEAGMLFIALHLEHRLGTITARSPVRGNWWMTQMGRKT